MVQNGYILFIANDDSTCNGESIKQLLCTK